MAAGRGVRYGSAMAPWRAREAALAEAGLALASERSLGAVLQRIVELAVEITGARYGALGVLGPEGRIAQFLTTGISDEERALLPHIPVGRGILGVLITDAEPLRLARIQDDPRSVGFPDHHPPMTSFLGAPVKARGRVFGNIYLTEKAGAEEFSEDDQRAIELLAMHAGVAIENARLNEEARQRELRLEAVREITAGILEGHDEDELLPLLVRRARELVGSDLSTLVVPAGPDALVVQAADGAAAAEVLGRTFPREGSIAGDVIAEGRAVVLDDVSGDDRVDQPMVRAGLGPAMFVPLVAHGRAFATLAVANRLTGDAFGEEDLALVRTFAGQAAVAMEYARAQRELQRLIVVEDRERIAKELHDGVIQSLFAVGMGLQGTAGLAQDPEIGGRIEAAVEEIDRVIRDLRNYIFGLRPGILADRQLSQALQELADDFQAKSGVLTVVDVDGSVAAKLTARAGDIVQLVREALSNVGRHAGAVTCRVSLYRADGGAVLEIDDDGTGFDVALREGAGEGLRNLRERAESAGGRIDIHSTPAEGTVVRATFPL
jgi:signal transduction histidine kinase